VPIQTSTESNLTQICAYIAVIVPIQTLIESKKLKKPTKN